MANKKTLIIDAGHGGTDTGAIGFGIREKDWNLRMSLYQYKRLKALGAKVFLTRDKDVSLSAKQRTDIIKKGNYDYCMSNHFNAFDGKARGVETIYSIFANKRVAQELADALVKATPLPLRRVFTRTNGPGRDYYFMHRMTGSAQTTIVEYGFMDNAIDHVWYREDANFYKAAEAVIEAWCIILNVKYKTTGDADKPKAEDRVAVGLLHKVQAGAFKERLNADKLHKRLQEAGMDAFVIIDDGLYKVQVGAYSIRENAEAQRKRVNALVGDAFIVESGQAEKIEAPKPKPQPKPKPKPQIKVDGILGRDTIRGLQELFGTPVDGILSGQYRNQATETFVQAQVKYGAGGSLVVRALQRTIGASIDGRWGPETTRALQRYLGTPVDGIISRPSVVIRELQRRINAENYEIQKN